jgi:hypothetical protein
MDPRTPAPRVDGDTADEGDRIADQLATTTTEAAGGTVTEEEDDDLPFDIVFEPEEPLH